MVDKISVQIRQISSRENAQIENKVVKVRRFPMIWIFSALLIGLGVIGLGAAGWWWFTGSENRIQPHVSAGALALDGLSPQEAALRLDATWNQPPIVLSDGAHAWQTTPAFLGLWMDPGATLQQAPILPDPQLSWQALETRWNPPEIHLTPVVRFDRKVAESQLTRWAEQVGHPAKNAELRLENGLAVATPGQDGSALDAQRTLDAIAADPMRVMTTKQAQVYFKSVAPQINDLSKEVDQVNGLLNLQLGGVIYDPITNENIPWQIPHDQVSGWVSLKNLDNGTTTADFDRVALVNYLADLPKHVDLGPERAIDPPTDPSTFADQVLANQAPVMIVHYLPTEYTVQSHTTLLQVGWKVGIQLWRLEKANPGVNPNALAPSQKLVIPAKTDLLPLPVVTNKRIIISITKQRMWVYENGEQIREFVISSGISSSPTQPGIYQVQTHDVNAYASNWNLWMPHWLGIYEAWPGFMNGIHGLPKLSNGVRLWANVLGKPASYGCIILNLENAEWLYNWAENGVVVEIQA